MDWRGLEAMTDRIVLDANVETVRHFPKNAQAQADPTRSVRDILAVLYAPDPDEIISFGRGFASSIVSSQWALAINRADYPDISFAKYDGFRAIERPGQPWFAFSRVTSHSPSVIIVYVTPG